MNKGINVKEKVIDKLSLPKDIVLDMPVIRVVGDREVIIDNHNGILEYTTESIKVKSTLGSMWIKGSEFQIKDISDESIFILGIIDSFEFLK